MTNFLKHFNDLAVMTIIIQMVFGYVLLHPITTYAQTDPTPTPTPTETAAITEDTQQTTEASEECDNTENGVDWCVSTWTGGMGDFDSYCGLNERADTPENEGKDPISQSDMFAEGRAVGEDEKLLGHYEDMETRMMDTNTGTTSGKNLLESYSTEGTGDDGKGPSEFEQAFDPENNLQSTGGNLAIPPCFLFYMNLVGILLNILNMFLSLFIGGDNGCFIPSAIGYYSFLSGILAFLAEVTSFFVVRHQIQNKKKTLIKIFNFFKCLREDKEIKKEEDDDTAISVNPEPTPEATPNEVDSVSENLPGVDEVNHSEENQGDNKIDVKRLLKCSEKAGKTQAKLTTSIDEELGQEEESSQTDHLSEEEAQMMIDQGALNLDAPICLYYENLIEIYKLQRFLAIEYLIPMYNSAVVGAISLVFMISRAFGDPTGTAVCGVENTANATASAKRKTACKVILGLASNILYIFNNHDYDYDRGASAASDTLYGGDIIYWINTAMLNFGVDLICDAKGSLQYSRTRNVDAYGARTSGGQATFNSGKHLLENLEMAGAAAKGSAIPYLMIAFTVAGLGLLAPYMAYYHMMIEQYNLRIEAVENMAKKLKCGKPITLPVPPPHENITYMNAPKNEETYPNIADSARSIKHSLAAKILSFFNFEPIEDAGAVRTMQSRELYKTPLCLGSTNPYKKQGKCYPTRTDALMKVLSRSKTGMKILKEKQFRKIIATMDYDTQKNLSFEQRSKNLEFIMKKSSNLSRFVQTNKKFRRSVGPSLWNTFKGILNITNPVSNFRNVKSAIDDILTVKAPPPPSPTEIRKNQKKFNNPLGINLNKIQSYNYTSFASADSNIDYDNNINNDTTTNDSTKEQKKNVNTEFEIDTVIKTNSLDLFKIISARYRKAQIEGRFK